MAAHDDTFIVFQAELKGFTLDATVRNSGIIASPCQRISSMDDDVHVAGTGELFAGSFSGWAHALRRSTRPAEGFEGFEGGQTAARTPLKTDGRGM